NEKERLHGWLLLSAHEPQGTVFFLHGNAQNISAHITNVSWLPEKGYQVFLLDYRGYGCSSGSPTISKALHDISAGFDWLCNQSHERELPIYLLGQSLGASLGAYFVGTNPHVKERLAGVIVDAGFANLRTIVREKLGAFWLTWPLQYPLCWLFPSKYNPDKVIHNISPVPLLIIHSRDDKVIPPHHGKKLYDLAGQPKYYLETGGMHISTFISNDTREHVVAFMDQSSQR
ncbi:MAG: alpha/beta hydrolase, partial [bacterium]